MLTTAVNIKNRMRRVTYNSAGVNRDPEELEKKKE